MRTMQVVARLVVASVVAALVAALVPTVAVSAQEEPPDQPANPWLDRGALVISHAGGEDEAPHSTLYAYKRAHSLGVDVLEGDVQLSADDVAVVHHDLTVDATTDGTGVVHELTWAELEQLDSAYNFTEDRWVCGNCPEEDYVFRGVRTGAVAPPAGYEADDFGVVAVASLFTEFPDDTVIDLEVKDTGQNAKDTVDVLGELIEQYDATDRVVLASFDSEITTYIRTQLPEVTVSPGVDEMVAWYLGAGTLDGYDILQVPPTFSGIPVVSQEMVDRAHAEGMAVWVWMDSKAQEDAAFYRSLVELGVEGILVSRPSVARDVVDDLGAEWRPYTAPSAPMSVEAEARSTTAQVRWEAPASNGGRPITGYVVRAQVHSVGPVPGAGADVTELPEVTVEVGPDVRSVDLADLERVGWWTTDYVVEVRAVNRAGEGEPNEHLEFTLGFYDVEWRHPFLAPISWMHDEGLTTGFDDGTFRPTSPVSRQALATVLWRNAGSPAVAPGAVPPFADVPADSPFADAITWAHGEQLVAGYADGTFQPTAPVSRQALAVILWRASGSPDATPAVPGLTDLPDLEPFATAIDWLLEDGHATGYTDGTFRPTTAVSRQALASIVHGWATVTEPESIG